jgi:hypothetical protein
VNIESGVTYKGQPWTSVSVDIARAEPGEADAEWVDAIALTDALGVTGPAQLPCLLRSIEGREVMYAVVAKPTPARTRACRTSASYCSRSRSAPPGR